jgi:hypothetical protein
MPFVIRYASARFGLSFNVFITHYLTENKIKTGFPNCVPVILNICDNGTAHPCFISMQISYHTHIMCNNSKTIALLLGIFNILQKPERKRKERSIKQDQVK